MIGNDVKQNRANQSKGERALRLQLAKSAIIGMAERQPGAFDIEAFRADATVGFLMYVTCAPDRYPGLCEEIVALGLVPDMLRFWRLADQTHYEVSIEVPLDWKPGQ